MSPGNQARFGSSLNMARRGVRRPDSCRDGCRDAVSERRDRGGGKADPWAPDPGGHPAGLTTVLGRALEAADRDSVVLPFVLFGSRALLEQQARRTTHQRLRSDGIRLVTGRAEPADTRNHQPLIEPLTDSEMRVLRCLPHPPLRRRDHAGALRVGPHRAHPHPAPLRQARDAQAQRRGARAHESLGCSLQGRKPPNVTSRLRQGHGLQTEFLRHSEVTDGLQCVVRPVAARVSG